MTTDLLSKILPEAGYTVSFRSDEWTDCVAVRQGERWRGRGLDEDDALEDVLRQMLPSSLARRLLMVRPSCDAAAEIPSPAPSTATAAQAPRVGTASSANGTAAAPGWVSSDETTTSLVEQAPASSASLVEQTPADLPDAVTSDRNGAAPLSPPLTTAAGHASSANGTPTADVAPNSSRIRVGAKTDRGLVRERNEDACLVLPERGLVAVAAGVGTQAGGDVASSMAIETLRTAFEGKEALSPVRTKALPRLVAAIERANAEVFNAGRREPTLRGRATSVAAVLVVGRQVVLAHVGDSRIYRLRRGVLGLLTNDHSVTNDRIRSGKPAAAVCGAVTRALGARRTVEVETSVMTSQPGDVVLLCTAGLHGVVRNEELAELLKQHTDPEVAVDQLLARVNALGGPDNATAAVVRWDR